MTQVQQIPKEMTLSSAMQETVASQESKPRNPDNYSQSATEFLKNKGAIRSGRVEMYDMRRKVGRYYTDEEKREIIQKMRNRDEEMVTGTFISYEDRRDNIRNNKLKFTYKKYDGEVEYYELADGVRYCLPYGVADHLQNHCHGYSYNHLNDEMFKEVQQAFNPQGKMIFSQPHVKEPVPRYGFIPLDFSYHVEEQNTHNNLAVVGY